MTRLPRLRARDLIRALEKMGFQVARTRGSHIFLRHSDGRVAVVPVHSGELLAWACSGQSFATWTFLWINYSKCSGDQFLIASGPYLQ